MNSPLYLSSATSANNSLTSGVVIPRKASYHDPPR
jgi:hypothetical protein